LSISLIIDFFNKVFDLDIRKAIKTKGDYDNQYKKLIEEFNKVLTNKSLNITPDRTGVTFEMEDEDGTVRELYPEDLSHGELKRLSIYLWLKYYDIKDSIVLMDEIEIAFHPDWQYQIIRDLQEWGPSNQYILATHSYELCEALTPAHVKEINPHLLPSQEHEPQS
jgi:predicted ATPase